ncbi:protein kinase [Patescibacteria group bacterium]
MTEEQSLSSKEALEGYLPLARKEPIQAAIDGAVVVAVKREEAREKGIKPLEAEEIEAILESLRKEGTRGKVRKTDLWLKLKRQPLFKPEMNYWPKEGDSPKTVAEKERQRNAFLVSRVGSDYGRKPEDPSEDWEKMVRRESTFLAIRSAYWMGDQLDGVAYEFLFTYLDNNQLVDFAETGRLPNRLDPLSVLGGLRSLWQEKNPTYLVAERPTRLDGQDEFYEGYWGQKPRPESRVAIYPVKPEGGVRLDPLVFWHQVVRVREAMKSVCSEMERAQKLKKEGGEETADFCAVQVLDYGEREGEDYLVLEYVDPKRFVALDHLASWREGRKDPLTIEEIIPLLRQVAQTVDALASQGVLHADLRLKSVLVGKEPFTKLAKRRQEAKMKIFGFGLAKAPLGADQSELKDYLVNQPPEVARSKTERPPSLQSVVYSLGVDAYRLLFGKEPVSYSGNRRASDLEAWELTTQTAHYRRLLLADNLVHPDRKVAHRHRIRGKRLERVDDCFATALAARPEDRFQTATEFVTELEKALAKKKKKGRRKEKQ